MFDAYLSITYVVAGRVLGGAGLDGVGDEAEHGADPQQQREAAEQLLAELDPLGRRLGRTQLVGSVTSQDRPRPLRRVTLHTQPQTDNRRRQTTTPSPHPTVKYVKNEHVFPRTTAQIRG